MLSRDVRALQLPPRVPAAIALRLQGRQTANRCGRGDTVTTRVPCAHRVRQDEPDSIAAEPARAPVPERCLARRSKAPNGRIRQESTGCALGRRAVQRRQRRVDARVERRRLQRAVWVERQRDRLGVNAGHCTNDAIDDIALRPIAHTLIQPLLLTRRRADDDAARRTSPREPYTLASAVSTAASSVTLAHASRPAARSGVMEAVVVVARALVERERLLADAACVAPAAPGTALASLRVRVCARECR